MGAYQRLCQTTVGEEQQSELRTHLARLIREYDLEHFWANVVKKLRISRTLCNIPSQRVLTRNLISG